MIKDISLLRRRKVMSCLRLKIVSLDQLRSINSDGVQSIEWSTRSLKEKSLSREGKRATLKKNQWKNLNIMLRLNPYAKTTKRMARG